MAARTRAECARAVLARASWRRRSAACRGSRAAAWAKPPSSLVASRNNAASATVRAIGPLTDSPCHASSCGPIGTRSRWGFTPKRPHQADGMRIEPRPSDPRRSRHARGHGRAGCRPTSRRRPFDVPWVARGAEGDRLGERPDRQLRHVRLAEHDRPRVAQPPHHLGVLAARAAVRRGAPGGRLTADVDVVLDRDRHAEHQALVARAAARVGLVGLGQRALGEHDPPGVQLRVEPGDPVEVGLHQLARRHVAGGDKTGLLGGSGEGEVCGVHDAREHYCPAPGWNRSRSPTSCAPSRAARRARTPSGAPRARSHAGCV